MTDSSPSRPEPIAVRVGCHALALCLEQLRQGSPMRRPLRLELSRTASQAPGYAYLRLSTYDPRGWWEYNGLAVETERVEPRTIVVPLPELTYVVRDAIATIKEFEATITWSDVLDVAGRQLETIADDEAPSMPVTRTHVQELAVPYPLGPCAIPTRLGRVCIDPDLAAHLAARNAASADLATVDDAPMLVARAAVAREATAAPIILAPLRLLAPGEEPPEAEPLVAAERRGIAADPLRHWLLALDADTHVDVILQLLSSGTATVRQRAALHPSLSDEILDELLRNGTDEKRAAVVLNPNLSEATTRLAAQDPSAAVRAALASKPTVTVEILGQLAHDIDVGVRAEVARNRGTPGQMLSVLARDDEVAVRAAAAENPRTDRGILRALSTDREPRVCEALARNPSCPPKVLRELVEIVPHLVLSNPATPRSLIIAGAQAKDPELRAQVARNPSAPANTLEMLADDPDLDVVHAVAFQSAAPKRARKRARSRLDAIDETHADFHLGVHDAAPTADDTGHADPFAASTPALESREMLSDDGAAVEEYAHWPDPEPADGYAYVFDAPADEVPDASAAPGLVDHDPEPVLLEWRSDVVRAEEAREPAEDADDHPASPPAVELVAELLDAIEAALSMLRRVVGSGDGALRTLTRGERTPGAEPSDAISTLAARLRVIAERTRPPSGDAPARREHEPVAALDD